MSDYTPPPTLKLVVNEVEHVYHLAPPDVTRLRDLLESFIKATKFSRGSEGQMRMLEEIAQSATYVLKSPAN